MKKTGPLTAGLAALSLAGAGVFAGQALSREETPRDVAQISAKSDATADVTPVATSDSHAAALTARLRKANVLAGLDLAGVTPNTPPMEFRPIGVTSADGYKATAVIKDGSGEATLTVFVQSAKKAPECSPANHCVIARGVDAPHLPAQTQTTARGAAGAAIKITRAATDGKATTLSATTKLADGTVVTAVVRAEVEEYDGETGTATVPSRAEVPLSEEQVIALVDRPGYHY